MCRRKLASTAITYGITGTATFNVLNIADFGANASSGLFEVSFNKDKGLSARLGTGGVDLSLKNLKSAISGLNAVNKNMQINKVAKQSNMKNAATALRVQYGFGDETQLANLDSILKGQSVLKAGKGEGEAQTITENGKRTIYLNNYKENMTREEKLAMGITIGHEAYRDGITSDAQSQYIETANAVLGHTVMAKKMQNDDMYNNIMAGIINNNQNLQNDLAVFDYAVETGDWGAFGNYVNAAYDSSADYWLFKLDGTIIDDQTNYFSREIIDVNGNHISEKIEGSDFEGSRIKALVEAIGIENVEKMLGESITSLNQIPDSVLESVLGVNIDISKIPETDKRMILEQNKEKIIGEYLMYKNNVIWDSTNSKWSGDELKIPGLGENDSLGVYRDDVTDQYTFFTAGITFTREDDAFEVYKNGVENKKYETLANTSAELWYKDLFNSDNNLSVSLDGNWTTVSHLDEDTTYKQYGYSSFKGNTIISEYFKMHLTTAFKNNQIQYNVDTVGVITDATTLYGQKIDKYGKIANQNQDWTRWLIHPMSQSGGSAGCFGPMSDFNVGNYTSGNVGTGKFYYDKFLSQLYSMNIYNGYELNMHLKGRRIP